MPFTLRNIKDDLVDVGSNFDGVESFGLEPVEVLHSPLATHIRYRRAG